MFCDVVIIQVIIIIVLSLVYVHLLGDGRNYIPHRIVLEWVSPTPPSAGLDRIYTEEAIVKICSVCTVATNYVN